MGNNPSRAQQQHHHNLLHPQGGSTTQGAQPTSQVQGSNTNISPQRSPALLTTVRRGSLPHTPSPTSTKQGLYPIRIAPGHSPVPGEHGLLDPRGLLSDFSVRRGSTGGVDIGSSNSGVNRSVDPFSPADSSGLYGGLPPQFRNPDPFQKAKVNKPTSFIAEEPGEGPAGIGGPAEEIQRRGSMRSTTTVEEDDIAIDESRTIPTLVNWPHGGNKVYITGTFCGWRKKYRLSKSPDSNMLSAIVPLPAGTHHVKFLVDGELRTSDALPTAVDSTGILVNYLEINADDMLAPLERQPSPIEAEGPSFQAVQDATQNPHHSHSHTYSPGANDHHHHHSHSAVSNTDEPFGFIKPRPQRYTDTIPAYLRDFEENQDRYAVSGSALNPHDSSGDQDVIKIPPPPALPLMLGKVILNSSSHLKDDNSVLGIPNHVVLNHLATSSIKNHVLAVSATTRYKKKYVSTILYKSTTE